MSQALRAGRLGLEQAMNTMLTRPRLVTTSALVGLAIVVAMLEHRVDPGLAVNRSLAAAVGLAIPLLALSVVRRDTNAPEPDTLGRHGAHQRWLLVGNYLGLLLWASLLGVLVVGVTRYLTRQAADRFLMADLLTCVGVGWLAMVSYAGTLTLVGRWGRGVVASTVLLALDFWLGHADSVVALLTLRGHVRNLLFGIDSISFNPVGSSCVLVVVGLGAWLAGVLRTRP